MLCKDEGISMDFDIIKGYAVGYDINKNFQDKVTKQACVLRTH